MSNLLTNFNNQNERSAYPFLSGCSRLDNTGSTLPVWFIADLGLTLPTGYGAVHMSSAYISDRLWSVAFSVADVPVLVASVRVSALTRAPDRAVPCQPLVPGAAGTVVFGAPSEGDVYRARYTYPAAIADNVRLLPALVHTSRHMPVRSLHAGPTGTLYARRAAGTVVISGRGDLVVDADQEDDGNIIFRLAGARENYLGVCDRPTGVTLPSPIRTINGVAPNANGLLTIRLMATSEEEP